LAVAAAGSASCYRPQLGDCAVRCGARAACPAGLSCDLAEGFCQADLATSCALAADAGVDGGIDGGAPPGQATYHAVVAGLDFACAIADKDDRIHCWGRGDTGELGDGMARRRALPAPVTGGAAAYAQLSAGDRHVCAIAKPAPGALWCWGASTFGRIPGATSEAVLEPHAVDVGGRTLANVAAGSAHTCAIDADGHLWCWGAAAQNQLGFDAGGAVTAPPTQIGADTWIAVSTGDVHSCGIRANGGLYCWGSGNGPGSDRLLGTDDGLDHPTPTQVGQATDWVAIVSAPVFNCGIRESAGKRTLWCWGRDSGNLGLGNPSAVVAKPTQVGTQTDWRTLDLNWRHVCATRDEQGGRMYCFGVNYDGSLGVGDLNDRLTPVPVPGGPWVESAAGEHFHCARAGGGAVSCWGDDSSGQLGDGQASARAVPTAVGGQSGWTQVSTGTRHTCALAGETLVCFGANGSGQLGQSLQTVPASGQPLVVPGAWKAVAAGDNHTCAITTAGILQCWGGNDWGGLGRGAGVDSGPHPTPAPVVGGASAWKAVGAGGGFTCAIGAGGDDGKLWCWGLGVYGQLAQDANLDASKVPLAVAGSNWTAIAVGFEHACGLRAGAGADIELVCWGLNERAQLGRGNEGGLSGTPTVVSGGIVNWTSAQSQRLHTCAVRQDGSGRCWGVNSFGTIGDGTVDPGVVPTAPKGVSAWRALGAGGSSTCGIDGSGALYCWGHDEWGQLADGVPTADFAVLPQSAASTATDWIDVRGGGSHFCARRQDGSLWCWGFGSDGALGDGERATLTPRRIADPE
jgi:alpha-tubulin suppressor-like RCC1 family protein